MPHSEVGPYRLLRLLKTGGEGSVYMAEDRRLGRRVAVKLQPLPRDARQRRNTLDSIRRVATLAHPSIVLLYDVIEQPDSLALVMEYVDGCDLEQLLSVAELDTSTVLQLGQDLCTALAAAHAQGIVHGDLKPGNVIIQRDGALKLTDFGQGTSASALSPEQVAGHPPSMASDMFALGCLLYRLLAGVHPFGANLAPSEAEAPGLSDRGITVPEPLEGLVFDLLNPDPSQRPSQALDVRQRLLSIARDFPAGQDTALEQIASVVGQQTVPADAHAPGPGTSAAESRRPLPAVVGGLVILSAAALWYAWPDASLGVVILPPQLTGSPEVSAQQLASMLHEAVRANPALHQVREPIAETLLLSVDCNEYLCSSQLVREGQEPGADMRALLPQADSVTWGRRLEQGLRELYSR